VAADLWAFERALLAEGYAKIAGVDEAGRGPLAGPVVSAAVMLPPAFDAAGINDSKQLTARQRDRLFDRIYAHAASVGLGIVDPLEIDRINILQAARLSMVMAVANLKPRPDFLLIDGNVGIGWNCAQKAIVQGDARSVSIAAASIVAKVSRDRLMHGYHEAFPQYGFDRHKGYPTAAHCAAIARHGPCPIHRRSFKRVCDYLPATAGSASLDRTATDAP
jgi:ribonuclease HII